MAPKLNTPSFRFPFNLEGVHAGTADAIRSLWNGFTVHEQAFAALGDMTATPTTTTVNETVNSTGVTSFNSATGVVSYFPSMALVNDQTGKTAYITQTQDNGALILIADASPIAVTLNFAVDKPWFTTITNAGAGTATVTPSSGLVNGFSSITIPGMSFATVFFDGTNWWADAPGATAGGVTQILAGTNVTLSPVGGMGVVTVNATAGSIARLPHNVTGSRAFGSIFQNTTGQEMYVSGYGLTSGGATGELTALVDTVNPPIADVWGEESTATVAGGKAGFGFIVPNNYFYELIISAGTGITSLGRWVEYF